MDSFNLHTIKANFIATIQNFGIWDVIDILILVVIFFVIIRFMRETRAAQLFKGIMLIILILLVMSFTPLKVTSFLFQNMFQMGILAVVVVFQPELRRMLEKIGNARVAKIKSQPEQRRARLIQGVSDACDQLLRTKTSAMIIIEQDTDLTDYIEHCTVIDGEPDPQLICNLFYFKAPMHGTAVVIRNDRVYEGGCLLKGLTPESTEEERFEALRSLVESTDALAITVSEHAGEICFMKKDKVMDLIYNPKEKVKQNLAESMSFSGDDSRRHDFDFLASASAREEAIAGIANACERLSRTRTGALIVIERNTRLGNIIEQSTVINAKPDPDFICNLFYNKAPLHDGAAIIRGNRVYAAGCFLPPTTRNDAVDSSLGSRHRAAIGMSENSDAMVIVVSEETGIISVAESGQLTRSVGQQDPKKWLTHILQDRMPAAVKRGFFGSRTRRSNKNGQEEI